MYFCIREFLGCGSLLAGNGWSGAAEKNLFTHLNTPYACSCTHVEYFTRVLERREVIPLSHYNLEDDVLQIQPLYLILLVVVR